MENHSEQQLKQQIEALQRLRVTSARRCATIFGIVSILALISFVYGYVQRIEAQKINERAEKEKREAMLILDGAQRDVAEAKLAMMKLEQLTIELEICRASKK